MNTEHRRCAALSRWLAWLCCLLSGLGWSLAQAGPLLQPVDLSRPETGMPLTQHMWVLKQPLAETTTADVALRASAWLPATEDNRRANFKPHTVWLLGRIENRGPLPVTRWLSLSPWRLHDVQLYTLTPDTVTVISHERIGLLTPREARTVRSIESVFELTLQPGETRQVLLRLQDKSIPTTYVTAWHPVNYREALGRKLITETAWFVAALTLLVLLLKADWRFTLLGVWLNSAVGFELTYEGQLLPFLFPGLLPHMVQLFSILGAMGWAGLTLASLVFLELGHSRVVRWTFGVLLGSLLICTVCSTASPRKRRSCPDKGTTASSSGSPTNCRRWY